MAFIRVTEAKRISPDRKEFRKMELPETLLTELQKNHLGGGEDVIYVHQSTGFTFDFNKDAPPGYFVHVPYASGSGDACYMIYQ
jgi:hypothetical protein